jgi:ribosome-binding factor A
MAKNSHFSGAGPSQRQLRVGELIRRTLADVLNRMSITVSEVRTSPDLKIATAYVLPLGGHGRAEAIEALARNKGELRRAISKQMALKYAPDLRFVLDETFDQMDATRDLLNSADVKRDLGDDG